MLRALPVVAISCAVAYAQTADVNLERVRSPKTSPSERMRLIEQMVQTDAGIDALARGALDATTDPEVVHMVVDQLLASGKFARALARVCLLLLDESRPALAGKVRLRIERAAEDARLGPELRERLRRLAEGQEPEAAGDPAVRVAAVRALSRAPHRDALAAIVSVWLRDASPDVKAECRNAVAHVLAEAPEEAWARLARHPDWTYGDFLRDRLETLQRENEELHRRYDALLREKLDRAEPDALLAELEQGTAEGRMIAAAQLAKRILANELPKPRAEEFARRIAERFAAELAAGPLDGILGHLAEALAHLAGGQPPSPFEKGADAPALLAAVQAAQLSVLESTPVGEACVRVLGVVPGVEAQALLMRLAQDAKAPVVRLKAVRGLLARARASAESRDPIGRKLAELLATETEPRVVEGVLEALLEVPEETALEPIRAILSGAREHSATALQDGIAVLRRLKSRGALDALLAVAASHPKPEVRVLAVAEGILPRAFASEAEEAEAMRAVAALANDEAQPAEVRKAIIGTLGEKGGRGAVRALEALSAAEGLSDAEREWATGAQFALAERLATPSGTPVPAADLAAALRLLSALRDREPAARVAALAERIAAAADQAQLPAGSARAIHALAFDRIEDRAPGEALRKFAEAADAAAADGVDPEIERRLLLRYRALLGSEPGASAESYLRSMRASRRLAELSGDDVEAAAAHLGEALRAAVRAKNRPQAQECYARMEALGLDAARLLEWKRLLDSLEAPAAPGPAGGAGGAAGGVPSGVSAGGG
jgi:hypothetical protein